ncbi:MAG: TRAP transporter substrate-binding protein DctP, partial [Desulfobulbaceae bacterium]
MRKNWIITAVAALGLTLAVTSGQAAEKREKFGADKRHEEVKNELRSITPSTETFKWKMVMPWTKGLLFYDMAQHFADSVALASGGRL